MDWLLSALFSQDHSRPVYIALGSGRNKTLPVASYLRGSGEFISLPGQPSHRLSISLPLSGAWLGTSDWPAKISQCPYLSLLAASLTQS